MIRCPRIVHHHALYGKVNGGEHPEQVSDHRAWLVQLIASTSSERDDELTKLTKTTLEKKRGFA